MIELSKFVQNGFMVGGVVARAALDRDPEDRQAALQKSADVMSMFFSSMGRTGGAIVVPAPGMVLAWCESGFPLLEPSHRLAASLMATRVPEDSVSDDDLPWRCFGIVIPAGLLALESAFMLVLKSRDGTIMIASVGLVQGSFEWGWEPRLSEYANLELKMDKVPSSRPEGYEEAIYRSGLLSGRLLVGLCLEMKNTPGSRGNGSVYFRGNKRKSTEPKAWSWRLQRSVKVDARPFVKSFLSGTSGPPSVQVMVRGHWKNQPHGSASLQRKWIHVEPYWRGPEDAPIGVRGHEVA